MATVKYWAGNITPEIIQTASVHTWGLSWLLRAQKAEKEGKELVILEVPKNELIELLKLDLDFGLDTYLRLDVG
jgi:hypothetical protein